MKKLIAALVCLAFVCGLSVSLTGCSKDKEKKPDKPAEEKKDKKD